FGEVEIGWRLRADAWGCGYATEAAAACLEWAVVNPVVNRVVSRTAAGNEPSRRLMKRLGMRRQPQRDYVPDDGSDRLVVYAVRTLAPAKPRRTTTTAVPA